MHLLAIKARGRTEHEGEQKKKQRNKREKKVRMRKKTEGRERPERNITENGGTLAGKRGFEREKHSHQED
jgi:hypothetical protein